MARRPSFLAGAACALFVVLLGCASEEEQYQTALDEAEAHLAAGDLQEAQVELQRALKLQPQSSEVNLRLGGLAGQQGRYNDAMFYFQEAWRLDHDDPRGALEAAKMIVSVEPDTAEGLVEEVLERFPDNPTAYSGRAAVALVRGNADEALVAALTATKLGPDDPDAWLTLGRVYMAMVRIAQESEEGVAPDEDFVAGLAALDRAVELGGFATIYGLERVRFLSSWPARREEVPALYRELLAAVPPEDAPLRGTVATSMVRFAERNRDAELLRLGMPILVELDAGNLDKWEVWARAEESIEPGGAVDVYEKLLADRPDDPAVHDRYALFLISEGNAEQAVAHLEEVAERLSSPVPVLARLADAHAELGDAEEAEAIVARLEREYPDDPQTKLARGRLLLRAGSNVRAAELLGQVAPTIETREAYYLLALAQFRNRTLAKAEDSVLNASRLAGHYDIQLARLRASIRYEARDWVRTIRIFRNMVRRGYRLEPYERVRLAVAHYELGRADIGRKMLEIELAEERPTTVAMRAWVQREGKSDPDRAREIMIEVTSRQPFNPRLVRERARVELLDEKPEAALAIVDEALARGVKGNELRLFRAGVLATTGDLDGALAEAERVRELDPENAGAQRFIAQIYARQDRTDELRADLLTAYEAGTLDLTGRLTLASLELNSGNYDRARELYEGLLEERPQHPGIRSDLALVLAEERQDLDRALELAQGAVATRPEHPRTADTLGYVYLRKGLTEPALSQFDAALQLGDDADSTTRALIQYHRGLALAELGRQGDADAAFAEARNLDPDLEMVGASGPTGS